jgi:primosomal protein N''
VLLGREFGWTLDEMRQLYPSELQAILKELQKQKLVDEYAEQKNKWAFLAAVIMNGVSILARVFSGRKKKIKEISPDDFISKDFKKIIQQILGKQEEDNDYDKHIEDAKQKGLKVPTKAGETV